MSTSHSLTTIEPMMPATTNGMLTTASNERSRSPDIDRNLCVTLDDRGKLAGN